MADSEVRQQPLGGTHARAARAAAAIAALLLAVDASAADRVRGAIHTATGTAPPRDARCLIHDNNTGAVLPPNAHGDSLFRVLDAQKTCPENALVFRDLLQQKGLKLHPAMVANRGYHNPLPAGSF